jgi:8-oxo-dGTP pyrophosphatase MutT (NUDIX family)
VTDTDTTSLIAACLALPGHESSDYDLNPDVHPNDARLQSPAAVLIGLQSGRNGFDVILTKRASGLKHHPGQIAFPGGRIEVGDADAVAAALREAREEIGLDSGNVEILGEMPPHETVTGFVVTPVLGRIRASFTLDPDQGEVEEVFCVPLAYVADKSNFRIERRQWRGQCRRYYSVPYGPYYIWGATARMLWALADRLNDARGR